LKKKHKTLKNTYEVTRDALQDKYNALLKKYKNLKKKEVVEVDTMKKDVDSIKKHIDDDVVSIQGSHSHHNDLLCRGLKEKLESMSIIYFVGTEFPLDVSEGHFYKTYAQMRKKFDSITTRIENCASPYSDQQKIVTYTLSFEGDVFNDLNAWTTDEPQLFYRGEPAISDYYVYNEMKNELYILKDVPAFQTKEGQMFTRELDVSREWWQLNKIQTIVGLYHSSAPPMGIHFDLKETMKKNPTPLDLSYKWKGKNEPPIYEVRPPPSGWKTPERYDKFVYDHESNIFYMFNDVPTTHNDGWWQANGIEDIVGYFYSHEEIYTDTCDFKRDSVKDILREYAEGRIWEERDPKIVRVPTPKGGWLPTISDYLYDSEVSDVDAVNDIYGREHEEYCEHRDDVETDQGCPFYVILFDQDKPLSINDDGFDDDDFQDKFEPSNYLNFFPNGNGESIGQCYYEREKMVFYALEYKAKQAFKRFVKLAKKGKPIVTKNKTFENVRHIMVKHTCFNTSEDCLEGDCDVEINKLVWSKP